MTTNATYCSNLPIPPGEFLEEVIEELGMTKDELARRMDRPSTKLSGIFKGEKAITVDTALQLEKVVGVSADIWTALETEYRLTLARQKALEAEAQLKSEVPLISAFAYKDLVKLKVVPPLRNQVEKVRSLQRFLGVTSLRNINGLQRYQPAFRCGARGAKKPSPEALTAWVRIGEIKARENNCAPFNRVSLKNALPVLRVMTTEQVTIETIMPKLKSILALCGVAIVFCPCIDRTYAQGAAFWANKNKAVIMVSDRYKRADIFWFSLLHEIGHLLLHKRSEVFMCGDDIVVPEKRDAETEADKFAADVLMSPREYTKFVKTPSFRKKTGIINFAKQIGIDPGIVVGRLRREKLLRQDVHQELIKRINCDVIL